jgi:hypothetical protein
LESFTCLRYPREATGRYGEIRMAPELTLVTDKPKKLGRVPGLGVERWSS